MTTKVSSGLLNLGVVHVRDEKASGTDAGTFTAGAWQTRTLNTTVLNTVSGASLGSNQVTLPAGTYMINASVPALNVNGHKARLYNTTDSSVVLQGTCSTTDNDTSIVAVNASLLFGVFTLSGTKTLEVQHYCSNTKSGNGFGTAATLGVNEVYTDALFIKLG
jgi:hypothetical protein